VRVWPAVIVTFALVLAAAACAEKKAPPEAPGASTTAADVDAGSLSGGPDAGKRLVFKLAAASFVASVSDRPSWPEDDAGARRLGYLRNGAIVSAYDPPTKNEDCKDGWYELVDTPGFVCGKVATIDLTNPRVKLAPKQPDRDAGMPYRYGINVSDGTPLYRRVLAAEERRKYEPHLALPKPDEASGDGEKDDEPPLAEEDHHDEPPRRHGRSKDRDRQAKKLADPFGHDAGRPMLKELRGRGVLVRRMARGFTVALDRDFKAAGTRWWRTTFGFAAPFDRIVVQSGQSKYAGNWFTGEGAAADLLPISTDAPDAGPSAGGVYFVSQSGAHRIELTDDGKGGQKAGWGGELPRRSAVLLTGRETAVAGVLYHQTSAGFWVRVAELRAAHPAIPADIGADEKWIDVDLTRQQLVAFEGRRPVFATLISSGRKNPQDKEHDFPTPVGTYRIREKHVTTTMDGDVAADGPYSIEDVPWVMYFQGSYAIHGAFWHDSFGNMRSHGCINMAPEDARTLFGWADPPLPPGWHGVFAGDDAAGSRLVIHEDTPPKRR
jgi:lipoprotein-anchoring transpeptidase ErfK/SrfK